MLNSASLQSAAALLQEAVDNGDIPSAVAWAGDAYHDYPIIAYGRRRYPTASRHFRARYQQPQAHPATVPAHIADADGLNNASMSATDNLSVNNATYYDLASLTKVMVTLPSVLHLVSAGEFSLEDKVQHFFAQAGWMQKPSLGQVRVRDLLTHSAGLPAWLPLFAHTSERLVALGEVLQSPLPNLGKYCYSDVGFILLGAIVERVSGQRLDAFAQQALFAPLGIRSLCYGPLEQQAVAATEDCGWRNQLLEGIVHDENAYALQGIAGHAGLFGDIHGVAAYARAWLQRDSRLASPALLQEARREQLRSEDGVRRGLGWMLKDPQASVGARASEAAYGHTGFTGTSLWVDPEQGWFAVLLSNRVHPYRSCGQNIHSLRRQFYEAVSAAAV